MRLKKLISLIICLSIITSLIPVPELTASASGVEEIKFSDSVVGGFRLQTMDFGITTDGDHSSVSVGGKFKTEISEDNVYKYSYSSSYPGNYRSYRSAKSGDSDSGWSKEVRWSLSADETKLLKKLNAYENNLKVGGKYDGHIDTQAGVVKGRAYMNIKQLSIDESGNVSNVASKETKMSEDEARDTLIPQIIDFTSVSNKVNSFQISVGGTTGNWFGKSKNYAEVHNPQIFLKDDQKPSIKSIKVTGGTEEGGKRYFASGDEVEIEVSFWEPIRCKDGNYTSAFNLTATTLDNFTPVKYDEINPEYPTLYYSATVPDNPMARCTGKFSVSVSPVAGRVSDLAGNTMNSDSKSISTDNIIIDGYIPRISKAEITTVYSKNISGTYDKLLSQKTIIKPGDFIVFKVFYNQELEQSTTKTSQFPITIGDETHYANVYAYYNQGTPKYSVSSPVSNPYAIKDRFDAAEYIIRIPENAAHGAIVRFPAIKSGGKWTLDASCESLDVSYGNLILIPSLRRALNSQTEIIAQSNENSVFEMKVDSYAPTIELTNENRQPVEGVYASAQEADTKGKKTNKFRVYLKSDEQVNGSVKAELKYVSKENPLDEGTIQSEECGAYMGDNIIEDMYLDFEIPKSIEIDSHEYDIFIETTVYDEIGNKNVQKFYLEADTKLPLGMVENGGKRGELEESAQGRCWVYKFRLEENSSTENARIYYKFESDEEYKFMDSTSDFTIKTEYVTGDESSSGTITYYSEDGSGNRSEEVISTFYISDLHKCALQEPDTISSYLPPRDIWFTDFLPPSDEVVGTVYDFLVYRINGGEWKYIKSETGNDIFIPKEELSDGCIISYKRIRNTDEYMSVEEYGEVFHELYHHDDKEPGVSSAITYDTAGNASTVRIASPAYNHPKNVEFATAVLSNDIGDVVEIDISQYVKNGVCYASIDLEKIIRENGFYSGRYHLVVNVIDKNGHRTMYHALGQEGKDIIIDAPYLEDIKVFSAHDERFSEEVGAFASSPDAGTDVVVNKDTINNFIHNNIPFTRKADAYRVEAKLRMKYAGPDYPKLDENDVWVSISTDNGKTWSEYEPAYMKDTTADIAEEDGISYAIYTVGADLPVNPEDGMMEYSVRFKCGANSEPGDIVKVTTFTDTTAPETVAYPEAVGSDENGWSEDIVYTDEYVRYRYAGVDRGGFMGEATIQSLRKILDKDGNEVSPADYPEYVQIIETDQELDCIIIKKRCRIFVTVSDIWNNSKDYDFECLYIDDLEPEYRIYNENTDEYTYALIANISSVKFGVVNAGTLLVDEEATERYDSFTEEGILIGEFLASAGTNVEYKQSEVYRFRQAQLSAETNDLVAAMYNKHGDVIDTFRIMTIASSVESPVLISTSGTAKGLGKTIRAVETMEFTLPVAQLTGEAEEAVIESGIEAAQGLYTADLHFSTTLNGVLDAKRGGTVYVIDRLSRIQKLEVDISGTEFVEYDGYNISYTKIAPEGMMGVDEDYIFNSTSGIMIDISSKSSVACVKPELSEGFNVADFSIRDESGSEFEGYYRELVVEASEGFAKTNGTSVVARIKVKDKATLEEYNDVVIVNSDIRPPVLLDSIKMRRTDRYSPLRIAYLFYDRYSISSVTIDYEHGYLDNKFRNGALIYTYLKNGEPTIIAVDTNGNSTRIDNFEISEIEISQSLVEGRDYEIEFYDGDMNPASEGEYFESAYIKIVHPEGGKPFSTTKDLIYTEDETDISLELVSENGEKVIHTVSPPIDRTPPSVFAYQNNSGEYVDELIYTISVSDMRSGVSAVYVKGEEGAENIPLTRKDRDSIYSYYEYVTDSPETVTLVAEDFCGNTREYTLKSNSAVIGKLQVEMTQNYTALTNRNVTVSLYSADGRRMYVQDLEKTEDEYLSKGEYIISGNDIIFTKNGSVEVECVDEAGNTVSRLVTVTNIDKTPPRVSTVVSEVKDENENVDTSKARVRFKAEGADDGTMLVYLLYVERTSDRPLEGVSIEELKKQWNEYLKNPEEFVFSEEVQAVFDKLYKLDIYEDSTYVDVTRNGEHTFYVIDRAGNIGETKADVTIIDETPPAIEKIQWSFDSAPRHTEKITVSGEADLTADSVNISKASTGYYTNSNVYVTLFSNEPIRIFGSGSKVYSTSVKTSFSENGIYDFVVEDVCGNSSRRTVNVSNIMARSLFIEFNENEMLFIKPKDGEAPDSRFTKENLTEYSVYTYNGKGEKVKLAGETDFAAIIDNGGLDMENLLANRFDRSQPYFLKFAVSDDAGNYAERTKRIVLSDSDDVFVTINEEMPNAASRVYTSGKELKVKVTNYGNYPAVVKVCKGEKNAAQMKLLTTELPKSDDGYYHYTPEGSGWYTVGVRTLYQDIIVAWVYVG